MERRMGIDLQRQFPFFLCDVLDILEASLMRGIACFCFGNGGFGYSII
jgi:hypothetical protein